MWCSTCCCCCCCRELLEGIRKKERLVEEETGGGAGGEEEDSRRKMDLSVLREQYRSATESQRRHTQVLLFRKVSSELSDAVDVFPVTQGLLSPWEPNSRPSPTATFDPSSVAYDPWHVHLDLHRRHCPGVNMAAPTESLLETVTLNSSHRSSSSSTSPRQEVDSSSDSHSSSTENHANEEDQDRPRCGPDPGSSDGSVRDPEMVDLVQVLATHREEASSTPVGGVPPCRASRKFSAPALRVSRQESIGGHGSSTGVHLNHYYNPFPNRKSPRISEAARRLGMYSSF